MSVLQKIFKLANSGEKKIQNKIAYPATKAREDAASITRKYNGEWYTKGLKCGKYLLDLPEPKLSGNDT